ncbi:MAG: 4-alpha-glucanotransferase [Chloroflexota bacterium]
MFDHQWQGLKAYAGSKDNKILGDLPIYVAHDSVDVWTNRGRFILHPDGHPSVVAGVPPDYFAPTDQLWGNPIFQWSAHAEEGYGMIANLEVTPAN